MVDGARSQTRTDSRGPRAGSGVNLGKKEGPIFRGSASGAEDGQVKEAQGEPKGQGTIDSDA